MCVAQAVETTTKSNKSLLEFWRERERERKSRRTSLKDSTCVCMCVIMAFCFVLDTLHLNSSVCFHFPEGTPDPRYRREVILLNCCNGVLQCWLKVHSLLVALVPVTSTLTVQQRILQPAL